MEHTMTPFVRFMVSPAGRASRIVAGIALILIGLIWVTGVAGYVLAAIGLVPLLAGAVDICVFAPLFGYPLSGEKARTRL
jgi:hypothetical protein